MTRGCSRCGQRGHYAATCGRVSTYQAPKRSYKDSLKSSDEDRGFVDALREWLGLAPLYSGADDRRRGDA